MRELLMVPVQTKSKGLLIFTLCEGITKHVIEQALESKLSTTLDISEKLS
jgi:hypothetical protein